MKTCTAVHIDLFGLMLKILIFWPETCREESLSGIVNKIKIISVCDKVDYVLPVACYGDEITAIGI